MKLYMNPASAPSRAILLFAAESEIELETQVIDLMVGEHVQPDFLNVNPFGMVPVLEDGDFRLTEGSAILKYVADKVASPAYPMNLKDRARINETMDWFNANLFRDFGHNLVYPQLFDHHHRRSEEGTSAAVAWGRERSAHWLGQLDKHLIGDSSSFVCLDRLTIADYFGVSLVTLGDAIQLDVTEYPNAARWIDGMKHLPSWDRVNQGFYGMVEAMSGQANAAA